MGEPDRLDFDREDDSFTKVRKGSMKEADDEHVAIMEHRRLRLMADEQAKREAREQQMRGKLRKAMFGDSASSAHLMPKTMGIDRRSRKDVGVDLRTRGLWGFSSSPGSAGGTAKYATSAAQVAPQAVGFADAARSMPGFSRRV